MHSYCALPTPENEEWVLATTKYGVDFISAVRRGESYATQFHPEKSGAVGLDILQRFLDPVTPFETAPQNVNGENTIRVTFYGTNAIVP